MWGLPLNASSHGHAIDTLIFLVHVLMAGLFFGWGIFFVLTLFKFRQSKHPKASYKGVENHFSQAIEIGVVVIEALLLIGLSIPFWAEKVDAKPLARDVEVRVVAEQFAWNVHYPGPDGVFGRTSPELIDQQSNPIGLDRDDPYAKDDITTINQLHLPIGKTAYIRLSTKDVIHSFFLPEMRVKQDVISGMEIPTWFTPTKTGHWEIACAQLCGLGHYRMRGFLTVHTQKDYHQWLEDNKVAASGDEGYDDFWN
jgi:cytochrome c oxidase subunit II